MITKDQRRGMILAADEHDWLISFGGSVDSFHFRREEKFVDVYFNRAGDMITEAWCDPAGHPNRGRMEPDLDHIIDYLRRPHA